MWCGDVSRPVFPLGAHPFQVVHENEMTAGALDESANSDSDSFRDEQSSASSDDAQKARRSSGSAMFILGKIALAVDKPGDALRWFKRGARHEDPSCLRELGARLLYSNAGGRRGWPSSTQPQDFDEAALLLQQAVNLGSSWAAYDLALMHIAGMRRGGWLVFFVLFLVDVP